MTGAITTSCSSITDATSTGTATVTSSSIGYIGYVLAEIRCATIRAELWQNDLAAIGLALKGGLIDVDNALDHLADCGALRLLVAAPPAINMTSTSS